MLTNLLSIWNGLNAQKKAVALLASIAIVAMVVSLARMSTQPSMSVLYSGLESSAAGDVISSLEAQGVAFEVRGASIYVPASQRDLARMTLAGQGLPATGGAGYELLDNLSGFGTTSQMFDAAYWRAKEGELARTIAANPNIRSARVHISSVSASPFATRQNPTASVSLVANGNGVSAQQAKALKFLIASAVSGMDPSSVSIIDDNGRLVSAGEDEASAGGNSSERAALLKASVERLLEARVGYGNAVVEVSLETVTETESVVERRFDPESRVAISTEVEEQTNSSQGASGGQVTVASNLPDGQAAEPGSQSSQTAQTRERTNFEVSEIQREVVRAPGAIKRMTVAVLVNHTQAIDAEGNKVSEERSAAEMTSLNDLVASAVGLDVDRGDVLTIESLPFEATETVGTTNPSSLLSNLNLDIMSLAQMATLAVVTLILGMFVLKPILTSRNNDTSPALLPPASPQEGNAATANDLAGPALTGEIDDGLFELPAMTPMGDFSDPNGGFGGDGGLALPEDPVERLKQTIEDRQSETMSILQKWMDEPEKAT
ncbi:flagellar basal-body MS-ring/collar protein FliF [Algirhabdus cladophorae]|uniref:flagellar basal-body MS-ring/collar protein FliF n=1 Tax=Algirhabdus cladophorae TaxID=3377108 RepID=UPI003B84A386